MIMVSNILVGAYLLSMAFILTYATHFRGATFQWRPIGGREVNIDVPFTMIYSSNRPTLNFDILKSRNSYDNFNITNIRIGAYLL